MTGHIPGPCPYCQTQMENAGAPIWEDYCPNKACTGHRDAFWASVRAKQKTLLAEGVGDSLESYPTYSDADALRDLQESILQSTSLADFMAVKKTVEAIRKAAADV